MVQKEIDCRARSFLFRLCYDLHFEAEVTLSILGTALHQVQGIMCVWMSWMVPSVLFQAIMFFLSYNICLRAPLSRFQKSTGHALTVEISTGSE